MSIRLSIEASDIEVERLISYLDSLKHLDVTDKIGLLKRAAHWITLSDPLKYDVTNPDRTKTCLLVRDNS